jgi:serine/threonine protein kinase
MPKEQFSAEVIDLLTKLLKHHPEDRLSASKAIDHPWFKELREQDKILQNQGSRRGHNLNDSMSHYSRQSEDLGGLNPTTSGVNHTVQNLNPPPLDSINRSKNGSNLNLAVTTHPAPSQAPGGHQGKSDK